VAIIVKNSIVPKLASIFFRVGAITLWPFIFIRKDCDTAQLVNHEMIHIKQCNELLVIGQYLLYGWDFVVGLIKYRNVYKAYRRVRFEQEAYRNDHNLNYLDSRPRFAWRKYRV
jgi:hypothetical protein